MDVGFFLKQRTGFIRQLYDAGTREYVERLRKIEVEEEPFIPPFSEDAEPAFIEEWVEANDSIQVLGRACLSMLSATLQLYFRTRERECGVPVICGKKSESGQGLVNVYRAYFLRNFGVRFEDGPVEMALLEEIVLARNSIQHPRTITSIHSHFTADDLKKVPHPFFIDEREKELPAGASESQHTWLMAPAIDVPSIKLIEAISAVERFAAWLDEVAVAYPNSAKSACEHFPKQEGESTA